MLFEIGIVFQLIEFFTDKSNVLRNMIFTICLNPLCKAISKGVFPKVLMFRLRFSLLKSLSTTFVICPSLRVKEMYKIKFKAVIPNLSCILTSAPNNKYKQ